MDDNVAIRVDRVSKDFKLPHEKMTSIKSIIINFYKRKRTYEIQQALKEVSFDVRKGEFFAIVGRNGSGKSTMLKLLAGIYVPNNGSVTVNGLLTPFIELGVGFNMELTGRENVYLNGALLGFNRKEMNKMYKDIVEFAELEKFMDQRLKNYSSGMQVRLAFSIAIRAQSDILLLDEVLAVGDLAFQKKSLNHFKQLKKQKKTVVFVSHDMESVEEFCDRGILLEDGVIKFAGTAAQVSKEYTSLFEGGKKVKKRVKAKPNSRIPHKRPGNGHARIDDVDIKADKDEIQVDVRATVHNDIEKLVYGFHITDSNRGEIVGLDNRLLKKSDIENLKAGSKIQFSWKIQNVFSNGDYYIDLTFADESDTMVDIFSEAGFFTVKKDQHSNTSILPPMTVTYKQM